MLIYYEPFVSLMEICLSTIPIYFSRKLLREYIQNVLKLTPSPNETNTKIIAMIIASIIYCCVLINLILFSFYPTYEITIDKIVGIFALIQSIFKYVHLLHFYVALDGMVEHLTNVEKDLEAGKLDMGFERFYDAFETYEQLGSFYQILMKLLFFAVFYDALTGVKQLEDFLFTRHELCYEGHREAVIIFWCWFHVPLLMLVLHKGQLFHEKVFFIK